MEAIGGNEKAKFAFVDINCSLAIRKADDTLFYFNNETELSEFLS